MREGSRYREDAQSSSGLTKRLCRHMCMGLRLGSKTLMYKLAVTKRKLR